MAFGGFSQDNNAPLAEINVVPLVDIMLVLLVIFIITAPVLTHRISVDLPKTQGNPAAEEINAVTVSIDASGALYWNDEALNRGALEARLAQAAQDPTLVLRLRADKAAAYDHLAQVLAASRAQGVTRIGFILETEHKQ
jgi:biopolymer transport protein ExbD